MMIFVGTVIVYVDMIITLFALEISSTNLQVGIYLIVGLLKFMLV